MDSRLRGNDESTRRNVTATSEAKSHPATSKAKSHPRNQRSDVASRDQRSEIAPRATVIRLQDPAGLGASA
jgi:hypothetical protein